MWELYRNMGILFLAQYQDVMQLLYMGNGHIINHLRATNLRGDKIVYSSTRK